MIEKNQKKSNILGDVKKKRYSNLNVHGWSSIDTQACPFLYVFSMTAFALQWQIWVSKITGPTKLEIFTMLSFAENM
jgi:hypothetical protein